MSPSSAPIVSIIIVSFNTKELLRQCLLALKEESQEVSHEIIVVDNASKDGSCEMVASEFPDVRLIKNEINLGFAAANNVGFRLASGKYFVLLNSDAFLAPRSLKSSIHKMETCPEVGLGGAKLVNREGTSEPSARKFPSFLGYFFNLFGTSSPFQWLHETSENSYNGMEVDWVPGAFSIIRRPALEEVGGFDERFFLYYEEIDLCKRIKKAGYKVWYWPDIMVNHLGGESAKKVKTVALSSVGAQLLLWEMRSELLYFKKHYGSLGVCFANFLRTLWHRFRVWKHALRTMPDSQNKRLESQQAIALRRRAWQETRGGKVSPPKPW